HRVEDLVGAVCFARNVRAGEAGYEAGVTGELARRAVVRVPRRPPVEDDHAWPELADDRGDDGARGRRVLEGGVGEPGVPPHGETEDLRRPLRLAPADLGRTLRPGLSAREVE